MRKWWIPVGVLSAAIAAWLLTSAEEDPRSSRGVPPGDDGGAGTVATDPGDVSRRDRGAKPNSSHREEKDPEEGEDTVKEYGEVGSLDSLSSKERAWVQGFGEDDALVFRGSSGLLLISPDREEEPPEHSPIFGAVLDPEALASFAELALSRQDALEHLAESMAAQQKAPRYSSFAQAERARRESADSTESVIIPLANGFVVLPRDEMAQDPGLLKLRDELEASCSELGVGSVRIYGVPDPIR